jgi:hypothetical protein
MGRIMQNIKNWIEEKLLKFLLWRADDYLKLFGKKDENNPD